MVCAACSLFWSFVYGHYIHYFHEWQTADAIQKKLEIEAKDYPTLAQGTLSSETRAPVSRSEIEHFQSNRLEAAGIYEEKAKTAKRQETRYIHLWQWLGRIAQASFLIGLGFLLAIAITNL
jgi:hypothetical protein